MSYSYSGDPTTSRMDAVRFFLDDKPEVGKPFLEDEEINYVLQQYGNLLRAAAVCAEQIALSLGKKATTRSIGDLSITVAQQRDTYVTLAKVLHARAAKEAITSFPLGGQSEIEKWTGQILTDTPQPAFRKTTGRTGGPWSDPRRGWN